MACQLFLSSACLCFLPGQLGHPLSAVSDEATFSFPSHSIYTNVKAWQNTSLSWGSVAGFSKTSNLIVVLNEGLSDTE